MSDITPSYDIDESYFSEMLGAAEQLEATLAATAEGRLIIYGVADAKAVADEQPFNTFYVEALDDTTLGFKF